MMSSKAGNSYEEDASINYEQLRRGPWTLEEDNLLIHYITCHGEGRWNSLAKLAGLKRTGKSCRLRWLNYLKPDIKRGNLTPHEQLLILELHSKWGNRWSKIAQHLPGRTDNEIKNYWRTRVQKQARQLKIDSNSNKFLEAIRKFWMPRLLEKMEQDSPELTSSPSPSSTSSISTLESTKKFTAENPPPVLNDPSSSNIANGLYSERSSAKTHELAGLFNTPSTGGNSLHENDFYQVGLPSSCDDKLELESQVIPFSGCHLEEFDWFGDDLGTTFWNTDEMWQ